MSEQQELQREEREALQSIYEGDENFKEINVTTFQYKYGQEDNYKSFLVELQWGENYPNEPPMINMDTFYNRNLLPSLKATIYDALVQEANQWLGCGMTYTLFECLKDRLDELTAAQPGIPPVASPCYDLDNAFSAIKISDATDIKKKEPKKEILSKAQKRRQWERTDHKGERARGWDWVDIIKHLSQTGQKDDNNSVIQTSGTTAPNSNNAASMPLHPLNTF